MHSYEWAKTTFASARNPERGKPLQNNTRLYDRGTHYAVRLHSTDVVELYPDGDVVLNTGGWFTVTTKDRINNYSPYGVGSKEGTWYLNRIYRSDEPRPEWPHRTIPKPYTVEDPGPEPVKSPEGCIAGTEHREPTTVEEFMKREEAEERGLEIAREAYGGGGYVYAELPIVRVTVYGEHSYEPAPQVGEGERGQYVRCEHCQGFQKVHDAWRRAYHGGWYRNERGFKEMQDCLERFGSREKWQEAYITEFREVREARKEYREWEENNLIEFFDGIRINAEGRPVNVTGIEEQAEAKAERDALKKQINGYVDRFIAHIDEHGLDIPGNGDCFYCMGLVNDAHLVEGKIEVSEGPSTNTDHLMHHIEEDYFVPTLAWSAVAEAGYRYPEVILGYDRETNRLGASYWMKSAVRRSLEKFMKKRLIEGAQPSARIHAASDR